MDLYKRFLSIFVLCFLPFLEGSSILFVHLGPSVPSYLFTTLKQARYFNPDIPIYLLCDSDSYPLFQKHSENFFEEEGVELVHTALIPQTSVHHAFDKANRIDPSLSRGYWMYASKRFFVLHDFIKSKQLTNVFHLESDTMLYAEVEELLPFFSHLQLAAPFQSKKGCIPCFVFIKDESSIRALSEHIVQEMKDFQGKKPHIYVNDMQTLASFYKKQGKKAILPLPTLMPDYSRYHLPRKSLLAADRTTALSFLSLHAESFPGYLFDGAGLGIFINGNDPRSSPKNGPGTVHSRCLFNPGFFSFFWGTDPQGRDAPYLSFKEKHYRIVNLHFHSKQPESYASFQPLLGPLPSRKDP